MVHRARKLAALDASLADIKVDLRQFRFAPESGLKSDVARGPPYVAKVRAHPPDRGKWAIIESEGADL